ncbi:hypothetical protein [Nonomuraea jiangxiensis]|uniref:Uncharacterized protein n=1 Tax=Nonomuraea jiangxiensis TaxID=633440 RepID=A0A1G9KL04_9ACTN|nr:hypothetical protein [Nonomuraea jiangxiensis]SDL50490.1 hypothetical protein SAMN05421869_126152 [Nonomuraea jiangxiensis]
MAEPLPGDGITRYESHVVAGPGGVMTDEVGVITGEVTVRTEVNGGRATVCIQYFQADEWYEIEGSPLGLTTDPGPSLHQEIVQAVRRGMPDGLANFRS